jgi:hypothetical protein
MSVFFLLKFWISFLGVGYIKHDPDLSQFLQIMICLSPQPVANLSIRCIVDIYYVVQIPKLKFLRSGITIELGFQTIGLGFPLYNHRICKL